uniref:Uncharacterized protein n=1 Tax=uncultured marine microorganism HF4000_001N02 TaxID=455504 RepID=B3T066_9ZZZZ|nr:hypothetical protein ALOHA_HF4000001N02ctg1g12 [uncultured marine microorganism HF4000_001N02]
MITRFCPPALRAVRSSLATWLASLPRILSEASKTRVLASTKDPHPLAIRILVHQFADRQNAPACFFNLGAGSGADTVGGDVRLSTDIPTAKQLTGNEDDILVSGIARQAAQVGFSPVAATPLEAQRHVSPQGRTGRPALVLEIADQGDQGLVGLSRIRTHMTPSTFAWVARPPDHLL